MLVASTSSRVAQLSIHAVCLLMTCLICGRLKLTFLGVSAMLLLISSEFVADATCGRNAEVGTGHFSLENLFFFEFARFVWAGTGSHA